MTIRLTINGKEIPNGNVKDFNYIGISYFYCKTSTEHILMGYYPVQEGGADADQLIGR